MCGDFLVSDELRKVTHTYTHTHTHTHTHMHTCTHTTPQALIMEDSEGYDIFSAKDRSELLFRVFTHITLGGSVNQVSPV